MSSPSDHPFVVDLIGQRIAGRYVVEKVLAAGGMGVVALARYPELEQEVAIKFMKPEYAAYPVLCTRFLREARLAARVKSPHFVRVYDFGRVDPGVPYLVMEMLTGNDLADEVEKSGAMAIPVAVDYLLQACVALAEVHGLGIVHRDLKPSNLFLAEAAGTRMLKVLDFGVSKESVGESLTSTGAPIGTPHYMSPEQVRESKTVDVRSDVWSLGVILYELLTTAMPFGGDGQPVGEVYGLIMHTDPVPPRIRLPALPSEMEEVILTCLRRDPADRYATVGALAEALRPFATPASVARIEAVHQILAWDRPPRALAGDSPALASPVPRDYSPSPAPPGAIAVSARAPASSDGGVDDDPPLKPTRALGRRARPETSLTSTRSSGVPELLRSPAARPGGSMPRVGIVALVVGIGLAAAGLWRVTTAPPAPPPLVENANAPLIAPIATPAAPPPVAVSPSASASAAPAPPPVASSPSAPVTAPASSPARRHGGSTPGAPKPPATAAPVDLLNDRK